MFLLVKEACEYFNPFCLVQLNTNVLKVNHRFTLKQSNKSVIKQVSVEETPASVFQPRHDTYFKGFLQEYLASGNKKRPGSRVVSAQHEL